MLEGGDKKNGVLVNGADEVTVRGFKAQNYTSNGFFFVNVVGYTAQDLIAAKTGVYGVYAFNSKGGTMRDSEAYYNNDAGFYIGQTPAQEKPIRSIVDNIESWGNPLGWSGTNMRYVTITNSRFYNNAAGIVPNALDSEKFPPAEDNIIADNEIFWNNFNFHKGAPFKISDGGNLGARAGRHRRAAARAAGATSSRTTGSTATGRSASRSIEGRFLLPKNPQARRPRRQQGAQQRSSGSAAPTSTGASSPTTATARTTASRATPGVSSRSRPTGRRSPRARSPARTPPTPGALGRDARASRARQRVAQWNRHPHAPKKGFEPLELYTP